MLKIFCLLFLIKDTWIPINLKTLKKMMITMMKSLVRPNTAEPVIGVFSLKVTFKIIVSSTQDSKIILLTSKDKIRFHFIKWCQKVWHHNIKVWIYKQEHMFILHKVESQHFTTTNRVKKGIIEIRNFSHRSSAKPLNHKSLCLYKINFRWFNRKSNMCQSQL